MNLFDLLDNLDLLPKRLASAIALASLIGVASLPPVRAFYLDQARLRGQEITQVIMKAWPDFSATEQKSGDRVSPDRANGR